MQCCGHIVPAVLLSWCWHASGRRRDVEHFDLHCDAAPARADATRPVHNHLGSLSKQSAGLSHICLSDLLAQGYATAGVEAASMIEAVADESVKKVAKFAPQDQQS